MLSRWRDEEVQEFSGELGQRVYTSRLLGNEPTLVLHGGGNTSVKVRVANIFGEEEEILYIKGSGWDLASIEAEGFAPVRRDTLLRLSRLPALSDAEMARQLRLATIDPAAPAPSVEAIFHALLPQRYVDHTHADALLAITNTPHGSDHAARAFGDDVLVLPYVMPGFRLAKQGAELLEKGLSPHLIGIVLLHHGFFTFGDTARESYERMMDLVSRAETYLDRHGAWHLPEVQRSTPALQPERIQRADIRAAVSRAAGTPMIVSTIESAAVEAFAQRPDLHALSQQGPATPDHVIRTKRVPLLGRDVERYAADYEAYFREHAPRVAAPLVKIDPAPRILLDPQLGGAAVGRTAKDAAVAADIYEHTLEIIQRAAALEGYEALPPLDIFELEYWELEQAKLRLGGTPGAFGGEVVLVTGAASGIGRACVAAFMHRGAAVVGLDVQPSIEHEKTGAAFLGVRADITSEADVERALELAGRRFGGLDMLVLNAGIFPAGRIIADLPSEEWGRVMRVNVDSNLTLLRASYPLLCRAPRGGRVVVVGSKNVSAPGPGVAAYSASKAALTQLARVAALEWGAQGIRVNVVHPNAVFDTGIWTEEVLQARATHYGLSVGEYKRNNVLGVEVTSADVAELVAEMCGPLFAKTTGAQVPIDGGNERVI